MHADATAAALIETMKLAQRIADRATTERVRKAANGLRDKAFAQYVWG